VQLNPAKMARPVHADGRRYVPAIDGLRVLAAFGVISAHVGSEFGPTQHLVSYYGAGAYPALIVFFTISGFLVYRPFARAALVPGTRRSSDRSTSGWVYLLRRVLRIFPLYWTVLAVTVVFTDQGWGELDSLTDKLQAIFLLPVPDPTVLLQGPLGIAMWTLAIELPFYVIVPFYASGLRRLTRATGRDAFQVQVAVPILLLAALYGAGIAFGGILAFPVMSLPAGMLLAVLETRQSLARRRYPAIRFLADRWWLCLVGYVVLLVVAAQLALDAYGRPGVTDPYDAIRNVYFPMQFAMAMLLFIPAAFGLRRSLYVRFFAAAPLQMIAPLTYGIYLWHVPLIHYTTEWFGPGFLGFPFPGTTGFGMPTLFIAIGLAIVTFVVVELPAAKLRDRVDRWSRGEPAGPSEGAELDVEPGEVGAEADLLVGEAEEVVGEAAREYRRMHGQLRRAGAAPSPAAAAQWCGPLDGYRAICAVLAVMGHTFLATGIFPIAGALHIIALLVPLFFAISAYVLYQAFIDADVSGRAMPSAKRFYALRFLRIYPIYALSLTLYLIVLPEVRPETWWGYARLYLFLQIFGEELSGFKGIPAAWYLCNEVMFYAAVPLLALGAARWSNRRRMRSPEQRLRAHLAIGWGMVFFGPLLRTLVYAADIPAPSSLPVSHLEFFGFGLITAAYAVGARHGIAPPAFVRWVRRNTDRTYLLTLIPFAMLALIAQRWGDHSGLWQDGNIEDRLRHFPYLFATALLMTAATLGRRDSVGNRFLASGRFKWLSALALHVYLWHQLVIGVINNLIPNGIGELDFAPRFVMGVVMVAVAVAGSIAVAWVSQPLTDQFYERYRQRHGMLRAAGAPPEMASPVKRVRPTAVG
jgi:peptidoglycan/LPS O-acetylase OafA/YrhL